jgi:hypothetical protein
MSQREEKAIGEKEETLVHVRMKAVGRKGKALY